MILPKLAKPIPILPLVIVLLAFFLRVWQVTSVPPSPYWEETAIGYDAFSVLKTGKDHHGHAFPLVAFESFGDYKPTLYFYAVIPAIILFGLNTFAVRLPSVVAGTLTVWGVGLITEKLARTSFKQLDQEDIQTVRYASMLFAAISPWAIQFSRAGWEVNLATTLVVFGVYFGMKSWQDSSSKKSGLRNLLLSAFLLLLSMYTYHATRMIAPLLGLAIVLPWLKNIHANLKPVLIVGIFSCLVISPLLLSLTSQTTNQRFKETSIFSDLAPILESNAAIQADGNTFFARLVHHRYLYFGKEILQNYLSHFNVDFLFINGDINPRHSIQFIGQLYYLDFFLLFLGGYFLFTKSKKNSAFWLLLFWFLIVPLPSAISTGSPHALRVLPMMPVYMILFAFGLLQFTRVTVPTLTRLLKQRKIEIKEKQVCNGLHALIAVLYVVQFFVFWHFYTKIYPQLYGSEWQEGYQQMVEIIEKNNDRVTPIFITREQGRPAMYYWFFTKTDPVRVQTQQMKNMLSSRIVQDQGEFLEFENMRFETGLSGNEKGLIASSPELYKAFPSAEKIDEVKNGQGETIWVIYRANEEEQ